MILQTAAENSAIVDTAQTSSGGGGWIIHHIMDSNKIDLEPFGVIQLPRLELFGIDISITKNVVIMWIIATILIILLVLISGRYKKSLIPKGIANFFEIIILFVKEEIVEPTIGKGYEKYLPYLLTVFFFVLFGNLFGLIPYSATITGSIAVTAALASISFFATQINGIRTNGVIGYFKGLMPPGMPIAIIPIMVIVEILGLFTKPFSLCIRLFANMIAGHVVILSLIGLIFILETIFVAPFSVAFALFIYLLEILVALIQAYVFTILTSLYIGMAVHQEH